MCRLGLPSKVLTIDDENMATEIEARLGLVGDCIKFSVEGFVSLDWTATMAVVRMPRVRNADGAEVRSSY